MKKQYLKSLWLTLALLSVGICASAYDFEVDGIYYNSDYTTCEVTCNYFIKYSGCVEIPSTVTYNSREYKVISIASEAFKDCTELTSITIPNSIESIGSAAFSG